jgi:GAF domain-containing protein
VDPEFQHTEAQKIANFRTLLGVPMIRLVETFADQAVIAIENVRLFEEAQARAREQGVLLGVFSLQRREVKPFTDKQIEQRGTRLGGVAAAPA